VLRRRRESPSRRRCPHRSPNSRFRSYPQGSKVFHSSVLPEIWVERLISFNIRVPHDLTTLVQAVRHAKGPAKPAEAPACGGEARALPGLCEIPTSLSVAAKTGMLAYTRQPNSDENIYLLPRPVPDGRGNPASLFVSSPEPDYSAEYSPDGTKVALVSRRSGHLEMWVCTASGADCSPVTSMRGPEVGSPKWSPDGLQIAFDFDQGGHYDISTVAVEGGTPSRITTEKWHQARPNWSADGRWIYFPSDAGFTLRPTARTVGNSGKHRRRAEARNG
jgi:hypothetical protein